MELDLRIDATGLPQPPPEMPEEGIPSSSLTTTPKTYQSNLISPPLELLLDADVTDCVLLPRTFWLPASTPTSSLTSSFEHLAKQIFDFHVTDNPANPHVFDSATSGAEWWCQVRPSPASGRYAATNEITGISKEGVNFHYDKDEELLQFTNIHVFPHISTVTYLSDLGAPTVVLDKMVDGIQTGSSVGDIDKAWVSFPRTGKHLAFDGRNLHAVVGAFKGTSLDDEIATFMESHKDIDIDIDKRQARRCTFLVNIWLNYKPISCERYPADNATGPFKLSPPSTVSSDLFDSVVRASPEPSTTVHHPCSSESSSENVKYQYAITTTDAGEEVLRMEVNQKKMLLNGANGGTVTLTYNDPPSQCTITEECSSPAPRHKKQKM
ncbi:hypothetical protein ScalyP_jg1136 [Parmales sp. scaly parma]|nr:hypothetical protein ScalyP_jg1136 [Parmales sp. scaly parma]